MLTSMNYQFNESPCWPRQRGPAYNLPFCIAYGRYLAVISARHLLIHLAWSFSAAYHRKTWISRRLDKIRH